MTSTLTVGIPTGVALVIHDEATIALIIDLVALADEYREACEIEKAVLEELSEAAHYATLLRWHGFACAYVHDAQLALRDAALGEEIWTTPAPGSGAIPVRIR